MVLERIIFFLRLVLKRIYINIFLKVSSKKKKKIENQIMWSHFLMAVIQKPVCMFSYIGYMNSDNQNWNLKAGADGGVKDNQLH